MEKAKISALIEKHRHCIPDIPDEVTTLGTGKSSNDTEKEGTPYKKASKASQIKSSQNKGAKSKRNAPDPILGDPILDTKKNTKKAKVTGKTDTINENDIQIYEFLFQGLPNLPDLEGIEEERILEIQRNLQEQLHQRDKERVRNITKIVKEFKKTFNFINSHLLK